MSEPPSPRPGHLQDGALLRRPTPSGVPQHLEPASPGDRRRRLPDLLMSGFGKGIGALADQLVRFGAAAAGPAIERSGRVIAASNLVGATVLGSLAGHLSGSPAETVGVGVVAAVAGGLIQKAAEAGVRKLFRKPGREDELAGRVAEYGRRIEALERALARQQTQLARTGPARPGLAPGGVQQNPRPGTRRRARRGGPARGLGR